ncbi:MULTISPECIES: hypothetical protein [Subtercola]|uniref:ATP/GTP-binding protein n=1 Tax=Subtercola vilae TaxID=2056433 RepID=A0A4T2C416_9MICO|nr:MULTISPECIES: hypothetical protein [Subtercola]MEA9986287.1 hypothetical protein [Subtercola sp. RTI3]TIH38272.1 hypothetical protein D4765_06705 [Subtercola vilae]
MPRSNRPRRPVRGQGQGQSDADESESFERAMTGWRTVEHRRGGDWNVQPISALQATKEYVCPGCSKTIVPGTAHLVTWRADGVMGDASDLAARRHWHTHCWKIGF